MNQIIINTAIFLSLSTTTFAFERGNDWEMPEEMKEWSAKEEIRADAVRRAAHNLHFFPVIGEIVNLPEDNILFSFLVSLCDSQFYKAWFFKYNDIEYYALTLDDNVTRHIISFDENLEKNGYRVGMEVNITGFSKDAVYTRCDCKRECFVRIDSEWWMVCHDCKVSFFIKHHKPTIKE